MSTKEFIKQYVAIAEKLFAIGVSPQFRLIERSAEDLDSIQKFCEYLQKNKMVMKMVAMPGDRQFQAKSGHLEFTLDKTEFGMKLFIGPAGTISIKLRQ